MFDCILVPLDGSAAAEAALTVAAQIPSDRVRLLAVASESTDLTTMCTAARDCQTYLEQIAKPLRRQGRKVRTGVALGDPVEQIVAAAAAADLIVMGSHGRGAAGRVVLGSVADWVARHASAPTLIVRSGPRPATALPPTRIVVPLDGSALAGQALATAGALAGSMRLPVHLVRVVDFDLVRAAVEAGPAAAAACARRQADLVRAAEAYLAGHAQALRDGDLDATSEVRVGPPVRELLAVIRESDLVVLATRGRGGIARWLLGSVAEQLVRHAAGPVLLVRAAGERPPTAAGRHRTPADDERVPTVQELFDLSGHVALVTGAGSGLGAVFAGALAEAGANVVCVGRRRERVEQTARRVREIGRQGLAIPADVTDDGAVADMVQQTVALRQAGHPGQQRGNSRGGTAGGDQPGRLAARRRRQPHGRLPLRPRGR